MPANKKYLSQSRSTRISKLIAVFIGAYCASASIHLVLAHLLGFHNVIATSIYSIFLVWVFFMVVVFSIKSLWKAWGLLLLIIGISSLVIYLKTSQ